MALITEGYRALNSQFHKEAPKFGAGGAKVSKLLAELMDRHSTYDVLDYGCGKAKLSETFPFVKNYDPCISEYSTLPKPADIVICRDVMEHVEEECVDEVLDHLQALTKKTAYFNIGTLPSGEILPDGRNAHITLNSPDWWRERLQKRWKSVNQLSYVGLKNVEFLCE